MLNVFYQHNSNSASNSCALCLRTSIASGSWGTVNAGTWGFKWEMTPNQFIHSLSESLNKKFRKTEN